MVDIAKTFGHYWPEYQRLHGNKVLPSHRAAVQAIISCRTGRLGGELYQCDCGEFQYSYHSCNNRACPKCGHQKASEWIERQRTHLLPVPYFMVTFTVPQELRPLFQFHQKELYSLLLRESATTLQEVAANPEHWGVELGLLGVLHTWTRQLNYHPHAHFIVPGGGLADNPVQWKPLPSPEFLLPVAVLSARFRTRFKAALSTHSEWMAQFNPQIWNKSWVVHVKPVGSGESALKYLSAYIYKTAITSQRILADDGQNVTFAYRDSEDGQWCQATIPGVEFLERFLQHILPRGFQRVRYYGWLSPAAKKRFDMIKRMLDLKAVAPLPAKPIAPPCCPRCQKPMTLSATFGRGPPVGPLRFTRPSS